MFIEHVIDLCTKKVQCYPLVESEWKIKKTWLGKVKASALAPEKIKPGIKSIKAIIGKESFDAWIALDPKYKDKLSFALACAKGVIRHLDVFVEGKKLRLHGEGLCLDQYSSRLDNALSGWLEDFAKAIGALPRL